MRLAISGSACQGKSTLVDDILRNWPSYKRSEESYRVLLKKEQIKINKEVNQDGQWKILNCLIDDVQKTKKGDKIIFDRCPLDNLIYSLWAEDKSSSDIDKNFISKCIPLVQESMKYIDIVFFLPITKVAPVSIKEKKDREIDTLFIKEIDNIFKAITYNLMVNGECAFMAKDDRPPIIEIFGSPEQRIEIIKLYLNRDGDLIDDQASVLNPENLNQMEALLKASKKALFEEKEDNKVRNKILGG
jgi:predicted ATPase